jgi:hypothetical protein
MPQLTSEFALSSCLPAITVAHNFDLVREIDVTSDKIYSKLSEKRLYRGSQRLFGKVMVTDLTDQLG